MKLEVPANLLDFESLYGSDDACRAALIRARWPDGYRCPRCGGERGHELRCRPKIECADCGHQASATAGTLFHSAKLPLRTLFRLTYMLVMEKSGTNVSAISRQLGISYRSALGWVQKIRHAMDGREKRKLSGTVEADEIVLGGKAWGQKGRDYAPNKAQVLVMAERKGHKLGRIRLEVIPDCSTDVLCSAIEQNVEGGSEVRTDGWLAYLRITKRGYRHDRRNMRGDRYRSHEELPGVHLVSSLLKRFLKGLLHGSWTRRWLQSILSEFEFRFNRRTSDARPLLFNRVIEVGVRRKTLTCGQLRMAAAWAA